jgi:hypothetical protein
MPSFVPREKPIRKQEQLSQREMELITAIRKKFTGEKLFKFVDKYRHSQLSICKANIHYIKELEYQKKQTNLKKEKIESEIIEWTAKTNEEIIDEITIKFINPKQ